jgi:hypothetical protein
VEKDLVAGNTSGAALENNALNPSNLLETSYSEYYQAYIRHQNGLFDAADSMLLIDLAQGCPALQGGVVFQAAALYNRVYHTAEVFTPVCSGMVGRGMQEESEVTEADQRENTQYKLFPVPNEGKFTIQGAVSEGDKVVIHSMNGEIAYQTEQRGATNELAVETNLSSGMYIVTICSGSGIEYFKCKIVIIK